MPHYRDGTPAQVGDVVVGRGYNVPHLIQGVVVFVKPGATACNIEVAYGRRRTCPEGIVIPWLDIEYGECGSFEKVG